MSTPRSAVSVRALVGFLLRRGDLERSSGDEASLAAGLRAHDPAGRRLEEGYEPEVRLETVLPASSGRAAEIRVCGRADGVVSGPGGTVVEEIKSTSRPLADVRDLREPDPAEALGVSSEAAGDPGGRLLDWAQAMCYASMLTAERGLDQVTVRLRYVEASTGAALLLLRRYRAPVLRDYLCELARRYAIWVRRAADWERLREQSIASLGPPFRSWRPGQEELMAAVSTALEHGERLFAQAPTGIGKTMAVLVPALTSMSALSLRRIFYLTPRGTTNTAPLAALDLLCSRGARVRRIVLRAKDKSCLGPEGTCLPAFCPYARGHYDRILDALEETLRDELIDAKVIERCARAHRVCPHELALDASEWCDVIIGDVNYVFDPRVYLRRYQDPAGFSTREQVYLIDEAHNLVDRAREMYSAELDTAALEHLERSTEIGEPALSEASRELRDGLCRAAEECEEVSGGERDVGVSRAPPRVLAAPLETFAAAAERMLGDSHAVVDPTVFDVLSFRRTFERFDERYATVAEAGSSGLRVKLSCLDPAPEIERRLSFARAAVFFSATLIPLDYHASVLGGRERAVTLDLPSPFPPANLCVLADRSVSTRYHDRASSLTRVAATVAATIRARPGGYLVFAPSYEYLGKVHAAFRSVAAEARTLLQRAEMSEGERRDFVAEIGSRAEPVAGFAVMGGLFGEAIDLPGEALSGVVVIGLGLPQPSAERELIRAYYDEVSDQGFLYAYAYPGITRVLQAAGRVIRGETDRGVVVLVDDRFCGPPYDELLPPRWATRAVRGAREVSRLLRGFWEGELPVS